MGKCKSCIQDQAKCDNGKQCIRCFLLQRTCIRTPIETTQYCETVRTIYESLTSYIVQFVPKPAPNTLVQLIRSWCSEALECEDTQLLKQVILLVNHFSFSLNSLVHCENDLRILEEASMSLKNGKYISICRNKKYNPQPLAISNIPPEIQVLRSSEKFFVMCLNSHGKIQFSTNEMFRKIFFTPSEYFGDGRIRSNFLPMIFQQESAQFILINLYMSLLSSLNNYGEYLGIANCKSRENVHFEANINARLNLTPDGMIFCGIAIKPILTFENNLLSQPTVLQNQQKNEIQSVFNNSKMLLYPKKDNINQRDQSLVQSSSNQTFAQVLINNFNLDEKVSNYEKKQENVSKDEQIDFGNERGFHKKKRRSFLLKYQRDVPTQQYSIFNVQRYNSPQDVSYSINFPIYSGSQFPPSFQTINTSIEQFDGPILRNQQTTQLLPQFKQNNLTQPEQLYAKNLGNKLLVNKFENPNDLGGTSKNYQLTNEEENLQANTNNKYENKNVFITTNSTDDFNLFPQDELFQHFENIFDTENLQDGDLSNIK